MNLPNIAKAKRVLDHRRPVHDPDDDRIAEARRSGRWHIHRRNKHQNQEVQDGK